MSTGIDEEFRGLLGSLENVYARRIGGVLEEVDRWRAAYEEQMAETHRLQEQLRAANAHAADLQATINDMAREQRTIADERDRALEQCGMLQHQAAQLQQFHQAISSMVTEGAPVAMPPVMTSSYAPHNSSMGHSQSDWTRYTAPAPDRSRGPRSTAPPQHAQQQQPPSSPGSVSTDAAAFYLKVKEHLAPDEFKVFAQNIKLLNSGEQTIEDTLDNIKQVLRDPDLYAQLHALIKQAVMEAAREAAEHGVRSVMDNNA